jgi:hypothetical protein
MKDFKKMPKMACGGGVKKMAGGGLASEDMYSPSQVNDLLNKGHYVDKTISKSEAKEFDKTLKIDRTKPNPARLGGGSAGTLPNDKGGLDRPRLYKTGGKVKRGMKK